MTKEEILAIKIGDQWLDSSGAFIGTCTGRSDNELRWTWHKIDTGKFFRQVYERNIQQLTEQANNITWIMLTPLLKELL